MKKAFLLDLLTILVGCSLMAAGLDIFVIPNSISPGGVSGLSAALVQLLPLSVGTLSLLINIPLLIAAWKVLGLPRVIRTLAATILLSLFLDVFPLFLPVYSDNILLAACLGGAFCGAGMGILFLRGISTGGTDLLSILLLRAMPNLPVGSLLMFADATVVLIAVLVFRDIEVALYSIVQIFVASKVIDSIMNGVNYAKVVYSITEHGEEVAEAICAGTDRGVTLLPARGGYTGREKSVVITVTRQNMLAPNAFFDQTGRPGFFFFCRYGCRGPWGRLPPLSRRPFRQQGAVNSPFVPSNVRRSFASLAKDLFFF